MHFLEFHYLDMIGERLLADVGPGRPDKALEHYLADKAHIMQQYLLRVGEYAKVCPVVLM